MVYSRPLSFLLPGAMRSSAGWCPTPAPIPLLKKRPENWFIFLISPVFGVCSVHKRCLFFITWQPMPVRLTENLSSLTSKKCFITKKYCLNIFIKGKLCEFFLLKLHTFLPWGKLKLKIEKLKVFEAVYLPFLCISVCCFSSAYRWTSMYIIVPTCILPCSNRTPFEEKGY